MMTVDGWTFLPTAKPEAGKKCFFKCALVCKGVMKEDGSWAAEGNALYSEVYEWKYEEEIKQEEVKNEDNKLPGNQ